MSRDPIVVSVAGTPRPAGSKKAIVSRSTGKTIVLDMSGKAGRLWRQAVAQAARLAHGGEPLDGPLVVLFHFVMPYPKAEKRRPEAKPHTCRPDTTKLVRSVEDACTGILWHDDAQIVVQTATKMYGHHPGVTIIVEHHLDAERRVEAVRGSHA